MKLSRRLKKPYLIATVICLVIVVVIWLGFEWQQNRVASKQQDLSPNPTNQALPQPSSAVSPTASPNPTLTPKPTTATPPPVTPTQRQVANPTHIPLQSEIVWGDRTAKKVYFTFDAGSGSASINQILQTLSQYQVESAFFVTGKWAEQNPESMKRIAREGHAIYNHTYSHPHLPQLADTQIKEEFNKTDAIIKSIVGFDSKPYFRAPYGERDSRVLSLAANLGYRHVYWTIDAWDWRPGYEAAPQVKARILDNLQPGTIYLMHVGSVSTGQVLSEVFAEVKSRGYTHGRIKDI